MATCIVNPRAAGGATLRRWPELERGLVELGFRITTVLTAGPGDATRRAREAAQGGAELVIAVGGDGTLNEVVNGLMQAGGQVPLAILPAGTGGDTRRTLGIPADPWAAARGLLGAETRSVDVGVARFGGQERYFLNIAEAGLGGAAVARVNRTTKVFGGFMSFLVGTLATFASYEPCQLTLRVDGGAPRTLRAWNVVVANGAYFGGGMKVLPMARMDDGMLEVMLVGDVPRRALFANIVNLYRGTHLRQAGVEHFRAREVEITAERPLLLDLDGEQPGTSPVSFGVRPGALLVRVPVPSLT